MTLAAYNSKYSNSSFIEKKTMANGFDDSGIRMNTWISKKDKWVLAELKERSQHLTGKALSIWAALNATLQWSRGDDIKSAKVYVQLNNVSIEWDILLSKARCENYEVINEAITSVRKYAAPLPADWKKKIDADYKKRGGKR